MSILIGGGQEYYGPTAARDKCVVKYAAQILRDSDLDLQVVTGGTAGIPDDFAKIYSTGGRVVDIVSSEYLSTYKERTQAIPRPYWVAGETQMKRRLAFLSNPDIKIALFIQGGKYTAHEIKLFKESGRKVVVFTGSGGASGGNIDYEGWRCLPQKHCNRPYDSCDPDADPLEIARDLVQHITELMQ